MKHAPCSTAGLAEQDQETEACDAKVAKPVRAATISCDEEYYTKPYNERNIDLAIRFSEQAPSESAYRLRRANTDDSYDTDHADFHDRMPDIRNRHRSYHVHTDDSYDTDNAADIQERIRLPDGIGEPPSSPRVWPSPNHILKVRK